MVLRVVSAMTQQFGHSAMCCSSLARRSASSASSRYSLSSLRNSLQVSKGVVSLALELARKFFAQLQARAKQAALDGRDRESQRLRRLFGRKIVNIAQHKNRPVQRLEALDR